MGLDQYMLSSSKKLSQKEITDNWARGKENLQEIFYFRKHHELHKYFNDIYAKLFNKDGKFYMNANEVLEIDKEILDQLEADISNDIIEGSFGFESYQRFHWLETGKMIVKVRDELAKGKKVYYLGWW